MFIEGCLPSQASKARHVICLYRVISKLTKHYTFILDWYSPIHLKKSYTITCILSLEGYQLSTASITRHYIYYVYRILYKYSFQHKTIYTTCIFIKMVQAELPIPDTIYISCCESYMSLCVWHTLVNNEIRVYYKNIRKSKKTVLHTNWQ